MTGTVFLVNPASGNGATGRRWPKLRRAAEAAGLSGDALLSEGSGQIADLAERAAAEGAALIAVVGGDGTLHEAVNGLMRVAAAERPELALLPQGTGDDFARALGIRADSRAALATAVGRTTRTIDIGAARGQTPDGAPRDTYFASMAGVGMSGAVAKRLNTTTKALGGRASSLIATLAVFARWRNVELTVGVDGTRTTALMEDVLVGNTEYHNGGMRLCPGARPDDGLLDVLVLGDVTKRDLAVALPKLYRGTYLPHPKATFRRAREVTVEAAAPLPVELDGEPDLQTPVTFTVVHAALRVRVPR